jgi:hypothetical protein
MSEKTELTTQQLEKIGGGDCTPEQIISITKDLTEAYESLVQFTTYVIERVSNT